MQDGQWPTGILITLGLSLDPALVIIGARARKSIQLKAIQF
jgi:hypothetical protein